MFWQLIIVLVLLIPILSIVLDSQVGQAIAARLERRGIGAPEDVTVDRIAFLEGEVEQLQAELKRLSDEGQFLQQLLEERPTETGALPPGDSDG